MKRKNRYFPALLTRPQGQSILASAGLRLEAILQASMLSALQPTGFENVPLPLLLRRLSSELVRNLTNWPPEMFVELHWTSWPNLAIPAHGRVDLTCTLNCLAAEETQAKAEVLARFGTFRALLLSHFPAAVFAPIWDADDLQRLSQPFRPQHCVALVRRRQLLNLKLDLPLSPSPIGFLNVLSSPKSQESTLCGQECIEHIFPWVPSLDSLYRLVDFLLWYPEPVWLRVRLQRHPDPHGEEHHLLQLVQKCELMLRSNLKAIEIVLEQQIAALRDFLCQRRAVLSQGQVRLAAFLGVQHHLDEALVALLTNSFLAPAAGMELAELFQGGTAFQDLNQDQMLDVTYYADGRALTAEEAASLFRLPHPPQTDLHGLKIRHWRATFADLSSAMPTNRSGILLGDNVFRGFSQPVWLPNIDRFRHQFIVGQTGTGKSTLLTNLIIQDLKAGRGLCLIDPDGELVETVLANYPLDRKEDLIIVDFADSKYPIALNLLTWQTEDERDFIIDELYNTIDNLYDLDRTGGPIFEQYFRGMLRLLMSVDKRVFVPTILELPLLFNNERFRHFCLKETKDYHADEFIKQIERADRDTSLANIAPYVTSKLNRFTHDQRLRRIFGQSHTSIDFSQIMDQGKVMLVNLRKGIFGATVSALVARQLLSLFQAAAMQRAFISPEKRRDFFLYVDECHNVVNESFAGLLSEARKYKVGLILCTQYTEQLQRHWAGRQDTLLSAILGNVGTIIAFRLGVTDAKKLEEVFAPSFDSQDLINLPNWEAYVKLSLTGRNITAFNLQTLPAPSATNSPDQIKELRNLSRQRYCRPAKEVDDEIQERWRHLREKYSGNYSMDDYLEELEELQELSVDQESGQQ
jgi:hypothetical protein